ncbi:hypothetical protein V6N13_042804 [Hibiscus sabdariffa]|uniref:Uncharacterized protein n=1 Tax=Hibiscus sabdariffa TaxID=183260 RepID=A0ABR2G4G9_9ROSI
MNCAVKIEFTLHLYLWRLVFSSNLEGGGGALVGAFFRHGCGLSFSQSLEAVGLVYFIKVFFEALCWLWVSLAASPAGCSICFPELENASCCFIPAHLQSGLPPKHLHWLVVKGTW